MSKGELSWGRRNSKTVATYVGLAVIIISTGFAGIDSIFSPRIDDNKDDISGLEGISRDQEVSLGEIRTSLGGLESTMKVLLANLDRLTITVQGLGEEIVPLAELVEDARKIQEDVVQLRSDVSEVQNMIPAIDRELALNRELIERELATNRELIDILNGQVDALIDGVDNLTELVSGLDQSLNLVAEQTNSISRRISVLEANLIALNETVRGEEPIGPQLIFIEIISPQSDDEVFWKTSVQGVSGGVYGKPDLHLYLLIFPTSTDFWWVQPEPVVGANGNWSGIVYFGRDTTEHPEEVGERFILLAIITQEILRPGDLIPIGEIPSSQSQFQVPNLVKTDR